MTEFSSYNDKVRIRSKIIQLLPKIVFFLLLVLPPFALQFASQTTEIQRLTSVIHAYLPIYIIVLLFTKVLSIVYPPLPGVVFTLASVPLIGWKTAYVVDICGSIIGATISFYLGKKYGYAILIRVLGKGLADKIATTKLKQKNQVEAAIFLRFAAGGMLSDGLAWGASVLGFGYLPFTIGYAISHVVTTLPVFYFIAASISFDSWVIVAIAAVLAWLVIYKFKGRYFE